MNQELVHINQTLVLVNYTYRHCVDDYYINISEAIQIGDDGEEMVYDWEANEQAILEKLVDKLNDQEGESNDD